MLEIVVATRNRGKLREIGEALDGLPLKLHSLDEFPDAPEVVEDGDSFLANAQKKAREIAAHTGMKALADDSGLVVDALDGAPGIFSARYAGAGATDESNNQKLRADLAEVPAAARAARFVCVMALCSPDGEVVVAEGAAEGEIIDEPRGDNGFGYDPIFFYPPLGLTFAELPSEEKHQVSHRGQALRALYAQLQGTRTGS